MHPNTSVTSLGTILGLWAHPDDESWLAAGLLMAARANGQKVVCVTATKGENGVQDEAKWPASQLGAIREKELQQSLKLMDITEHYWLDYRNDLCDQIDDTAALAKILPIVKAVKPDTIVTFAPDGFSGHLDHQAVSRWATLAAARLDDQAPQILQVAVTTEWYARAGKEWDDAFNVFFNLDQPPLRPESTVDFIYNLPSDLVDRKLQALAAQPSQTEKTFATLSTKTLRTLVAQECFVRG